MTSSGTSKSGRGLAALALGCCLTAACSTKSGVGSSDGGLREGGRRLDAGFDDDGGGSPALDRCIAICEAQTPAAVDTLHAIFTCAFDQCSADCDPAVTDTDAGAADAGDVGAVEAGVADAGTCRVGRAPGQFSMLQAAVCDVCVGARCCDKVNACLDDAPCATLNGCEDRCVVDSR